MGQITDKNCYGGERKNGIEDFYPSSINSTYQNNYMQNQNHPRTYMSQIYTSPQQRSLVQNGSAHQENFLNSQVKEFSKKDAESTIKQDSGGMAVNIDQTQVPSNENKNKDRTPLNEQSEMVQLYSSEKANQKEIVSEFVTNEISDDRQQKYQNRIMKLSQVVSFAPILQLTVISSANMTKGQVLKINSQGLLHGQRNEKDGYTFFGCKKKAKRLNKFVRQTQILNDFIIPPTDPQQVKQQRGRHFQIRYDIPNNYYTIVDLGVGFGAFKRLDAPHLLRNHDLISFGLTLCIIKFLSKHHPLNKSFSQNFFEDKQDIILCAQFFGGLSNGEIYQVNPNEFQQVSFGRQETCSLSFKDKLISKKQAILEFNPKLGWILKDGDGSTPSTNGTWLYIQKEEQIVQGMFFKANQTVFQASIT